MNPIGILTDATCSAACWYAREETCRCSCAGANHGCLLRADGEMPRRNCVIQGVRYVLGRISPPGDSTYADRYKFAHEHSLKMAADAGLRPYSVPASNMRRAIVWERAASAKQVETWPEMASARELPHYARRPDLIWIREDAIEAYDAWIESRKGG